jgi:hypothetical protein
VTCSILVSITEHTSTRRAVGTDCGRRAARAARRRLLFNERGEWSEHLNVYVDGVDVRERGGLASPLADVREMRVVGMISGG